jgi:hypothetical protein
MRSLRIEVGEEIFRYLESVAQGRYTRALHRVVTACEATITFYQLRRGGAQRRDDLCTIHE